MKLADARVGNILFWGPNEDGSQALVISEDPCGCGWPERITYVDRETLDIVRSGCAGCEAERPVVMADQRPMASTREAVWFLFWLLLACIICWGFIIAGVWVAVQFLLFMGSFIVPTISY